jgi:hypothetical protein
MRQRSRSTQLMLATVLALAVGAGPLIAGGAGATTNSAADFSGLVDIGGGRKIYMECRGKGSPTVVLVSGLGNAADIWSVTTDPKNGRPVFAEVAKFISQVGFGQNGIALGGGRPTLGCLSLVAR